MTRRSKRADVETGCSRLFPAAGAARWRALTQQSVADGLLDAAVLGRYELLRRPEIHWSTWRPAQMARITGALDQMQAWAPALGDRVDNGTITMVRALGYLEFRSADRDWRSSRPALAAWYEGFAKRLSMGPTVLVQRRLEPYASAARISAVGRTRPKRGRMFSTEKR